MIETRIRGKLQPFFNLFGRLLLFFKLTPNNVSFLAFISGIVCAVSIALNNITAAFILLWVSGLFDVLDGTIAKLANKSRKIGIFVDLIADRMVECAIILGFSLLYPQYNIAYLICLAAIMFHFSVFLVASNLFKNKDPKTIRHGKSIIERTEIFIVFAFMMLFPKYIFETIMLFNLALFASGFSCFLHILENAKRKKQK